MKKGFRKLIKNCFILGKENIDLIVFLPPAFNQQIDFFKKNLTCKLIFTKHK